MIVGSVAIYALLQHQQPPSIGNEDPALLMSDVPSNWETYQNSSIGFELKIPRGSSFREISNERILQGRSAMISITNYGNSLIKEGSFKLEVAKHGTLVNGSKWTADALRPPDTSSTAVSKFTEGQIIKDGATGIKITKGLD
jgi:hypothetical protein